MSTETIEEWSARTAPTLTETQWRLTDQWMQSPGMVPSGLREVGQHWPGAVPWVQALLAYRDKVARELTEPRRRALAILAEDVEYSPGESYCNRNGTVRSDVMRRLSAAKLVRSWGLHEWGPHPVYVWTRTDFGAEVARVLEASHG